MGLRGLFTYMNKVPGGSRTVNIIEEIQKFRRDNGTDPVIIINLWTLATHYSPEFKDKILGCRLNELQERFETFLKRMRECGAVLTFVFKKTQHKESDFIVNYENDYQNACKMFEVVASSKSLEKIASKLQGTDFWFPFNNSVFSVFAQVAMNFGKLHGVESGERIPSAFHVRLANKNNAMAMMGTDTYYIFYDGPWKFWADAELDMENMTIKEYDKEIILENLQLSVQTAPLFVTLAGGLYSSEENIKKVLMFFKPWTYKLFENVAKYVNLQRFPLDDDVVFGIIKEITGTNDFQLFEDITKTMKKMNANIESVPNTMEYFSNDFMSYGSQILENEAIFISPVFTDLRKNEMSSLETLVTPWIQKIAGIILKNQKGAKQTVTLIVKKQHDEKFQEIKIPIISPNFTAPSMIEIANDRISVEKATQMLIWLCGFKPSTATVRLNDIPFESLGNFIILAHLVRHKYLKIKEVNLLLRTIEDMNSGKASSSIQYPTVVNERALRISFLFTKLQFIFNSCLRTIGLQRYDSDLWFDNVYFHLLHEANNTEIVESLDEVVSILQCFDD